MAKLRMLAPQQWRVIAAFAAVYLIWGSTYLAIALSIQTLPPFTSGAVRFLLAGALMYGWLKARESRPFADVDLKRAGRIDRKIPFFYPQTKEEVSAIGKAAARKNKLNVAPEILDASAIWEKMIGYSAADIEAVVLLAGETAARDSADAQAEISAENLESAFSDYFPSRDTTMLSFMEYLAVFECSNRKLLPPRYARRAFGGETPRTVCDYLAGMTDRFAQEEYLRLFHPFTSV